jgi:predicted DNA-binding transcriptional regulator AlpA
MRKQHTPAIETTVRFIDSRATEQRVGASRWTLWRWERDGRFPRSISLGTKRVWVEDEVDTWMRERIAERDAR